MSNSGLDGTLAASEEVRKLAQTSNVETLMRLLVKCGNLNHISVSSDADKGKTFVALFRDTIGMAPYRYVTHEDPVMALKLALASVVAVQRETTAEAMGKTSKKKAAPVRRIPADEDDLI